MKYTTKKKWQFTFIYFFPVFIIFSCFSIFIHYSYSEKIYEIDDTISEMAFGTSEYREFNEYKEYKEAPNTIIAEQDWNTLSMEEIDKKLIENGLEPIGNSKDPFYYLTPKEIKEKLNKEAIFWGSNPDGGVVYTEVGHDLPYISLEQIEEVQDTISQSSLMTIIVTLFGVTLAFAFLAYYFAGKAIKPLQDSIEKQKQFVSDSSHEIKTPLALIKSEAEVLLRDKNSSINEYQSFAKNTVEDVNRLDTLADSLLWLAQLDQKKKDFALEKINLSALIQKIANSFGQVALKKKITINADIEKDIFASANRDATYQVLNIILDNALKFSPEKSKIDIYIKQELQSIIVNIKDCGIGISKKDLSHIFDRFYRASEDRHEKGYGLGLAIAKEAMLAQGGNIKIKSALKRGTIVELRFKKG